MMRRYQLFLLPLCFTMTCLCTFAQQTTSDPQSQAPKSDALLTDSGWSYHFQFTGILQGHRGIAQSPQGISFAEFHPSSLPEPSSSARRMKSSRLPRTNRDWTAAIEDPVMPAISARSCPATSCKNKISARAWFMDPSTP